MKIEFNEYDMKDFCYLLDIQREYAINGGAKYIPGNLWIRSEGNTNSGQVSFYNGHVNMIERVLLTKGVLKVDFNNKHYIEWYTD